MALSKKELDLIEGLTLLLKESKTVEEAEHYKKEICDIKTYYTEDSVETITIEGNVRPLQVKDMRRKTADLEQKIRSLLEERKKEKKDLSVKDIRELEGW